MRTLFIDCASGMSGDMMLAAFVDMGLPVAYMQREFEKLGISKEFQFSVKRNFYQGKKVTSLDVNLENEDIIQIHPYSGRYRNYQDILDLLEKSNLSDKVKALSRKILSIKAEAEASVHGVPLAEVQFHEAGAVDSIVDIVGATLGIDYFGIKTIISTEVPTGYGSVLCACGELPVPAPAVKQILKSTKLPHYRSDIKQELLTPTGAAILAGVTSYFTKQEVSISVAALKQNFLQAGYGIGKRITGLPPLCLFLSNETIKVS